MLTDFFWVAVFSIALYPLMLIIMGVSLSRHRHTVEGYFRRLAGFALRSSFVVVFFSVVAGGVFFVPWVFLLSITRATDSMIILIAPPFAAAFGLILFWTLRDADKQFLEGPLASTKSTKRLTHTSADATQKQRRG